MNDKFEKLFKLYESVTMDIIVDGVLDNSWGRKWKPQNKEKLEYMQDKGELLLKFVPENSKYNEKLNKILNDLDSMWREAQGKGLL